MIQKTIDVSSSELPMKIVVISDMHIGMKGFREDILDDALSEMDSPNTYWVFLGDGVEGREPGHKYYDFDEIAMNVGDQYEYMFDKFRPYMSKCLGFCRGNHEEYLIRRTTIDNLSMFCADNKVTYFGDLGRLTFKTKSDTCSMVLAHGCGGGAKPGAPLNRAFDYAKNFQSNVFVCGHAHKMSYAVPLTSYITEEGKQSWQPQHVIVNGSMFETFRDGSIGSYAERGMMSPNALGYTNIILDKKLRPSVQFKVY